MVNAYNENFYIAKHHLLFANWCYSSVNIGTCVFIMKI